MNLFGIWQMQKIEQVYAVPNPTLPAPETFNFLFKNAIYCKKRENLHAALVSQVLKKWTFPLSTKLRSPERCLKCNFWEPLQAKKDWKINSKEDSEKEKREKDEL